MQKARRVGPSAVEVAAGEVAAVVADDDAVWVEHGHNFENERVAKQLGLLVVLLKKKLDGALDHKLAVAFTRMDT